MDWIAFCVFEQVGAALLGGDEVVDAFEGGVNSAVGRGEQLLNFIVVGHGYYDGDIAKGLDAGVGIRGSEVRAFETGVPEAAFESIESCIHAEEVRVRQRGHLRKDRVKSRASRAAIVDVK